MLELDHILWAAADLAEATAAFDLATGVTPAIGGSHAGFGTRNSLVSLGDGKYLEVLAVDPEQTNLAFLGLQHRSRSIRLAGKHAAFPDRGRSSLAAGRIFAPS